MHKERRMMINLSIDEFDALSELSSAQCRHPKDQARFLLRTALGLDKFPSEAQVQPLAEKDSDFLNLETQQREANVMMEQVRDSP